MNLSVCVFIWNMLSDGYTFECLRWRMNHNSWDKAHFHTHMHTAFISFLFFHSIRFILNNLSIFLSWYSKLLSAAIPHILTHSIREWKWKMKNEQIFKTYISFKQSLYYYNRLLFFFILLLASLIQIFIRCTQNCFVPKLFNTDRMLKWDRLTSQSKWKLIKEIEWEKNDFEQFISIHTNPTLSGAPILQNTNSKSFPIMKPFHCIDVSAIKSYHICAN